MFRPFNADRLVVKLTGTYGFESLMEPAAIPVRVLNGKTVVGLEVNSGRVEFDDLQGVTPNDDSAAPVLIEQPQDLGRFRGAGAEVRVTGRGPGPLKHRWCKDTTMTVEVPVLEGRGRVGA